MKIASVAGLGLIGVTTIGAIAVYTASTMETPERAMARAIAASKLTVKQVADARAVAEAKISSETTGSISPYASIIEALNPFGHRNPKPKPADVAALVPPEDGLGPINTLPDPAKALGLDLTGFREALPLYRKGDIEAGDAIARTAKDDLVRQTLEWVAIRNHPAKMGLPRLTAFMKANPDWPAMGWLKKRAEEALYVAKAKPAAVKAYFADTAPETPHGKIALARVFLDENEPEKAKALIRNVWREGDLTKHFEDLIKTSFAEHLTREDHKYRADRLTYKDSDGAALRAAALAGADVVALIKARMALNNEVASDKLVAAVPEALKKDPGLQLGLVHKARKAENLVDAANILHAAPKDLATIINGDEWWTERRVLARKLLDKNETAHAYKLCAEAAPGSNENRIEAEFHAGWIALRFLDDAILAQKHFIRAASLAETPHSVSRTAYWQGRVAELLPTEDSAELAKSYYEKASSHSAAFYGQLARVKLGQAEGALRAPPAEAQGNERAKAVRMVELLYASGEKEIAQPLVMESVQRLKGEAQVAALARVVSSIRDARTSLVVGKLANQRGIAIDDLAFPSYGVPQFAALDNSAARSVVFAIARQESAFDPRALSHAGAKGLMQMITPTARSTAKAAGVAFEESRLLSDASFNAQLGARHLGDLLKDNGGSYILTFAAYNAGPRRVKEWIAAYGDPRTPNVDPIDWIERIPFTETRNYVQRVSENLTIYRARFNESAVSLSDSDLKRKQAKL